jgi:hypothetical protein
MQAPPPQQGGATFGEVFSLFTMVKPMKLFLSLNEPACANYYKVRLWI